ncbi:MAG: DNA repair protein RecN [Clostridiales bacterium]
MLAELYVENFALIENLRVEFYDGLNIISGETGAGKSLLTDAVGILMGGRADKEFIRYGSKKALVEGTFIGPFSRGFLDKIEENGIKIEDETLVVSREINVEGKNLCRIDGRRVSLNVLSALLPYLMNMHSQTEHFSFLKEDFQITVLDKFGGAQIDAAKETVAGDYKTWAHSHVKTQELKKKNNQTAEKLDFLQYRLGELGDLNLVADEDENLRNKINMLKTGTERFENSYALHEQLATATENLYEAMENLKELANIDTGLAEFSTVVTDAYYNIEDVRDSIRQYRDNIEADPQGLENAQERLSILERIKKKYSTDLQGLLAIYDETKAEINTLEDFDYLLKKLQKIEVENLKNLHNSASALTDVRRKFGEDLASKIKEQLRDLMLPHANFKVDLEPVAISVNGGDHVRFLISMNKGEDLKPLAKVASGGEISRILLAMKVILGSADQVQTMIFDEIDSGMGGKTIGAVGEKLRVLAESIQVFAVTHSAIVAAKADHHFYIEKSEFMGRTTVDLTELSGENIKTEIARMLSGNEKSSISLSQAAELLKK